MENRIKSFAFYSKQQILNVEVKRTLDGTIVKRKNKPDITVIEKSKEQIQIIKKFVTFQRN